MFLFLMKSAVILLSIGSAVEFFRGSYFWSAFALALAIWTQAFLV
ncbi:TMhelix containing protein [Vibrio phage 1.201.B._10N.286.55.F1]|nr:TMhelix containing protein [Vibrio phage 1.201.B._10N.286.55.F1]